MENRRQNRKITTVFCQHLANKVTKSGLLKFDENERPYAENHVNTKKIKHSHITVNVLLLTTDQGIGSSSLLEYVQKTLI